MPDWELFARDAYGVTQAQIDGFTHAEIVPRHNDVGTWTLDLPATDPAVASLLVANGGVRFVRDGDTVLSGPTVSRERSFDGRADRIVLAGVDDNVWLARRLTHPQPATPAPPYNSQAYDVRAGVASTVMREFVDVNAGPSALNRRRALTLAADPAIGRIVTMRGRWQTLLAVLQFIANRAALGFRVRDLTFEVFEPIDRSATISFSLELGNLAGFRYSVEAPESTYAYVAGGGEGTARVVVEDRDMAASAAWGVIESFRDRRDTTDPAELADAAVEELTDRAAQSGISITPIDLPGRAYGVDYAVGDLVSVVVDGLVLTDVVREARITLDGDRNETIVPSVGSTSAQFAPLKLFAGLRRLSRRLADLERR